MPILGCIADDFTGAGDAASFLASGGISVSLICGIPKADLECPNTDAIVIALKTRTEKVEVAVESTIRVVRWLLQNNIQQIYLKYCSTFDSTPAGNIGPIVDAVLDFLKLPYTILCPALPVNGRVVQNGVLYVNGIPLDKSPMRNHPLTPMWNSRIANLMEPQSHYPCVEIHKDKFFEIEKIINKASEMYEHFYIIPDFTSDEDARFLIQQFGHLQLLTGGSGILKELAGSYCVSHEKNIIENEALSNRRTILLVGSCSQATLEQIQCYLNDGGIAWKLDPILLIEHKIDVEAVWDAISKGKNKSIMVYTSEPPNKVKKNQQLGGEKVSNLVETVLSKLAVYAIKDGYNNIIVAGGETSGAITQSLGFRNFLIGDSIAPGVPIMIPAEQSNIHLVLKSGNFGQPDFFKRAITSLGGVL